MTSHENGIIRLLRADEIECRIAAVSEKGLSLLLYKDARVDQKILDETFGPFGWKRSHQSINGNLYCTVEVRDKESGEWISKQDVGTTGYAEKEKSQASDSFKRACFNWGIGRELYTAPFIWVPAGKVSVEKKGDRFICNDRFHVQSIGYNGDREICSLVIADSKGWKVYEWKLRIEEEKEKNQKKSSLSRSQMDSLKVELKRTGVTMEAVQERYHIEEPKAMSKELYEKVMLALSKTKNAEAA